MSLYEKDPRTFVSTPVDDCERCGTPPTAVGVIESLLDTWIEPYVAEILDAVPEADEIIAETAAQGHDLCTARLRINCVAEDRRTA